MKEMCSNFLCNTTKCPAAQQQNNLSNQNNQSTTQSNAPAAAAILPDTSMGDCNACVQEQIGLAQAFIPNQPYEAPMGEEQSLVCGTAFSALVMPYCAGWNLSRFAKEVQ